MLTNCNAIQQQRQTQFCNKDFVIKQAEVIRTNCACNKFQSIKPHYVKTM